MCQHEDQSQFLTTLRQPISRQRVMLNKLRLITLFSMKKAAILSGIVTIFGLFFSGCATGPKYLYTEQKDSASVGVGPAPDAAVASAPKTWSEFWSKLRSPDPIEATVGIQQVDGLSLGSSFFDSSPKQYLDKAGNISMSPGNHTLVLTFNHSDSDTESNADGSSTETTTDISAMGTVNVEFAANHIYRLEAFLSGSVFSVTLWDDTGGPSERSRAGYWMFTGRETYSAHSD
jgi:hypothetical protein